LRAEIEPVSSADFMRFLFQWQHVTPAPRLSGIDGLRAVLGRLDGFEVPASAWERSILPARLDRYDPAMLDALCFSGDVGWARLSPAAAPVMQRTDTGPVPSAARAPVGATPVALFLREHADAWHTLRRAAGASEAESPR